MREHKMYEYTVESQLVGKKYALYVYTLYIQLYIILLIFDILWFDICRFDVFCLSPEQVALSYSVAEGGTT